MRRGPNTEGYHIRAGVGRMIGLLEKEGGMGCWKVKFINLIEYTRTFNLINN